MKEKSLFTILLVCMIGSAIVLFFTLRGIDDIRAHSANIGPGGFNSLMQIDRSMDAYSDALEHYIHAVDDPSQQNGLITQYQKEFDIVWGNLAHFNLRFLAHSDTDNSLDIFKHVAEQFLTKVEPSMAENQVLSTNDVLDIIAELGELQNQVHALGLEYFYSSISFRDNWVNRLNDFHRLLLFFSAAFGVAACSLVTFLIRSNNRKNVLVREADEAHAALNSTVAELRSGRREQRAKDSFIAAASHDLRQPLHALGLFLGSLDGHVSHGEGRKTLNDAIQCSDNLGTLFNSMLDLSRLDAGIVEAEKSHFDIVPFLQNLQDEFHAKALNKSIDLQLNADNGVVYTDPILLSRIVRNLIENAMLHSGANIITISCTGKGANQHLEIQDNGRGIAQIEQNQVFIEYYQIKNRPDGNSKGLGLGLSIVKRLSDLLKIKIELQSEPEKFTKFRMVIPSGDSTKVVKQTSNKLALCGTPSQRTTIAIVDDDEKICAAMSAMLGQFGLDVVASTTVDSVIDKLVESNRQPHLIVADYRLQKGQTGDQAIVQLKRALNLDVPALLVTGDTSPAHVAEANDSGYEVLHKPVQPAVLISKINELVTTAANSKESSKMAKSNV